MSSISFYTKNVSLVLDNSEELSAWASSIISGEKKKLGDINVVFVSDDDLLEMNKKFLNRDYLTDTITFPDRNGSRISGEAYISYDRVMENARVFKVSAWDELCRVVAHSILHLMGYDDVDDAARKVMSEREDFYLNLRPS